MLLSALLHGPTNASDVLTMTQDEIDVAASELDIPEPEICARISREVRLISRPKGLPTADNFMLVNTEPRAVGAGEVFVRNLFMSVDPYMRRRMDDRQSHGPPFDLGNPLEGGAVGEVLESYANEFRTGDIVTSNFGWRECFVTSPLNLRLITHAIEPASVYLGILGMTGMTAWAGLNLVDVKAPDVVFVSGAAGAVGNVAGQLAKLRGCRVIGSSGSPEKVKFLLKECGFDSAFNYKVGPIGEQLRREAPEGIDVYFDNVGGETLEAALASLRTHGRIIACGAISEYNEQQSNRGPSNLCNMKTNRLTMKGLVVRDHIDEQSTFEAELGAHLRAGNLKNKETVVNGIEHAVDAFIGLFKGQNIGKMVVRLA
jgi:NADPH-dependent curcumin reductase CurA